MRKREENLQRYYWTTSPVANPGSTELILTFHVVARLGLWNKHYETLNSSYSVTATADLLDFKLVLVPQLNWLVEGTFKAHAFHLVLFVQLVFREKT